MIIDLTPLNYNNKTKIEIDEKLDFSKEQLENTDLIDIKNAEAKGNIYKDSYDNYNLYLNIKGKMILPCSRTLKPTEYDFDMEIDEILKENNEKFQKTIDIFPIIWENILMEIPISIVNEEAKNIKLQGDGWELITDSEK